MLRFLSGLVHLIEPNRRRSPATLRIWRLKIDQKWRKDEFKNAKLFMTQPLLSCSDIETLLAYFLPRRNTTTEEVFRQMEFRHKQRQASINSAARGKINERHLFNIYNKVELLNGDKTIEPFLLIHSKIYLPVIVCGELIFGALNSMHYEENV